MRRRRHGALALGQPQQGESGLRVAAVLARPAVGVLGPLELAAEPEQLRQAVQRLAQRRMTGWARELLVGPLGLVERLGPVAAGTAGSRPGAPGTAHGTARARGCASHQRLSAAVHSCARRRSSVRWHISITAQYASPAIIGDTSPAVTATMTSSSSANPSPVPPPEHERLAPPEAAERRQVGVAEPLTDGQRLGELGERVTGVAREQMAERHRQEQEPALDAVVAAVVEQTPGPRQPTPCRRHLAAEEQAESEPERAARRTRHIAKAQTFEMGTFRRRVTVTILADEIRRHCQPLQVVDAQRRPA